MTDVTCEATEEKAAAALARSRIYGFFALLLRDEPKEALIQQLKSPEFVETLNDLDIQFGEAFFNADNALLIEDLAVEFTRLFIGPGSHISPHESVHIEYPNSAENTLMGAETVVVKRFIEATGLHYRDEFHGLPDHISAELELMQKLTEREGDAWNNEDQKDAVGIEQIQKQFFTEHILLWVPHLCDKIIDMAELPYYREIAVALKDFVDFEQDNLIHQKIEVTTA